MPAPGRQPAPAPASDRSTVVARAAAGLSCSSPGVWLGGHPSDLPAFARSTFVSDHSTQVVDEAINRIASDYYRPIPKSQLADASISGRGREPARSLLALSGPAANSTSSPQPPSFTGIGVMVGPDSRAATLRRGLLIGRVFDSSPAQRARTAGQAN